MPSRRPKWILVGALFSTTVGLIFTVAGLVGLFPSYLAAGLPGYLMTLPVPLLLLVLLRRTHSKLVVEDPDGYDRYAADQMQRHMTKIATVGLVLALPAIYLIALPVSQWIEVSGILG